MTSLKPYSKAVVAVVGAIVTGLTQVFPDSPDVSRWCAFVLSVLTVAAVYLTPNADPAGTHQAESVQPPQASLGDGVGQGVASLATAVDSTADGVTPAASPESFVGDTTPPKPGEPDKGGYWGGV